MKIFSRLPAYALNGAAVALGLGCIQILIGTLAGSHAAQLALSGAICASLADVPNTLPRSWRRVATAATLSASAKNSYTGITTIGAIGAATYSASTSRWPTARCPTRCCPSTSRRTTR